MLSPILETLAMMVGPAGHVLRYSIADRVWMVGTTPVSDDTVSALLLDGYVYPTRVPTVSGSTLTGRLVISAKGKQALYRARRAA